MTAPSERALLRVVEDAPLTPEEIARPLNKDEVRKLLEEEFARQAPLYPDAVIRRAFGR